MGMTKEWVSAKDIIARVRKLRRLADELELAAKEIKKLQVEYRIDNSVNATNAVISLEKWLKDIERNLAGLGNLEDVRKVAAAKNARPVE